MKFEPGSARFREANAHFRRSEQDGPWSVSSLCRQAAASSCTSLDLPELRKHALSYNCLLYTSTLGNVTEERRKRTLPRTSRTPRKMMLSGNWRMLCQPRLRASWRCSHISMTCTPAESRFLKIRIGIQVRRLMGFRHSLTKKFSKNSRANQSNCRLSSGSRATFERRCSCLLYTSRCV